MSGLTLPAAATPETDSDHAECMSCPWGMDSRAYLPVSGVTKNYPKLIVSDAIVATSFFVVS